MHDFYNDYESNFISSRFDELSKNRLSCLQRTKPVDKTEIHNERIIRRCR